MCPRAFFVLALEFAYVSYTHKEPAVKRVQKQASEHQFKTRGQNRTIFLKITYCSFFCYLLLF